MVYKNHVGLQNNKIPALKLVFFIARRFIKKNPDGFSDPIIRIAITAVALGLAVMILSVAIITGFQQEIREKVIGFGGHVQITHFDSNISYEPSPISRNQDFIEELSGVPGIKHIQVFASKPGIIRTDDDILGVVLKGVGADFDWSFFGSKLTKGSLPLFSDTTTSFAALISKKTAAKLRLDTGDDIRMFFIIDNLVRARRFTIEGIFETGLEEFDELFVICDIRHIQRLNSWSDDQIAGFEILVHDFRHLDAVIDHVHRLLPYDLYAASIRDLYPQIFDWLQLQDMNVIIVLTLMVLVAVITMISALLIIILERTNTIGLLKALGLENWSIRKVFITLALNIALKGIFWGNLIGLSIAYAQQQFGIIKLSQESYYVSTVPIEVNLSYVLILNLGTLIISIVALLIPSAIISAITPVKAIRFE
jgi:lipoprotein-releasing system permease protein